MYSRAVQKTESYTIQTKSHCLQYLTSQRKSYTKKLKRSLLKINEILLISL